MSPVFTKYDPPARPEDNPLVKELRILAYHLRVAAARDRGAMKRYATEQNPVAFSRAEGRAIGREDAETRIQAILHGERSSW